MAGGNVVELKNLSFIFFFRFASLFVFLFVFFFCFSHLLAFFLALERAEKHHATRKISAHIHDIYVKRISNRVYIFTQQFLFFFFVVFLG